MKKDDFYWFYNLAQINFFIRSGAEIVEVGYGTKNDLFVKFTKNNKSKQIFDGWMSNKKKA